MNYKDVFKKYYRHRKYRLINYYYRIVYKYKKIYYDTKAKFIIWLVGNSRVIINCTIYDDIFEFNFGKTRSYKPDIAFNNKIVNLNHTINDRVEQVIALRKHKIQCSGRAVVLNMNL